VRQLEDQLEKEQKEHQAYRSGVTTHFQKTAELVGKMTDSYKAVYDHLAYGSQTLCGDYDALTSSVFGPPRIIHDPKIAVGETVTPARAAGTSSPEPPRAGSGEERAPQRESFEFGEGGEPDAHDAANDADEAPRTAAEAPSSATGSEAAPQPAGDAAPLPDTDPARASNETSSAH